MKTEFHEPGESPMCERCGRRLDPDPIQMWNGLIVRILYDAWGIAVCIGIIGAAIAILTGGYDTQGVAYAVMAFLALMLVDLLVLMNHIMKNGWPCRTLRQRM